MSNVVGLQREDWLLGHALIEFGRMLEDGRAMAQPSSPVIPLRPQYGIPQYLKADFPMNGSRAGAEDSLRRARSQCAKGRMSAEELAQIEGRYKRAIAFFDSSGT